MKVDYVFCLPGHPSSAIQANSCEYARLRLQNAGKTFALQIAVASDVFTVRNMCLGQKGYAVTQKPFQGQFEYDRMIWIDSDNIIAPDDIEKLTAHDVDIVAGWCRVYNGGEINNNNKSNCGIFDKNTGECTPYTVGDMLRMRPGLLKVDYVGFGIMVVKSGVFEAFEFPWFEMSTLEWRDGKGDHMRLNVTDDLGFCLRAKAKGFEIYVDPSVMIYHEKKVMI